MKRLIAIACLLPLAASFSIGCSSAESPPEQNDDSALSATDMNQRQHKLYHFIAGAPSGLDVQNRLGIVKWDAFAGRDRATSFDGAVFYASDKNNDARYVFAVSGTDFLFMVLNKDGKDISGTTTVDEKDYALLQADVAGLKGKLEQMRQPLSGQRPSSPDEPGCALGIAIVSIGVIGLTGLAALTPVGAVVGGLAGGILTLGNGVGIALGMGAGSVFVLGTAFAGVVKSADFVKQVKESCSAENP
jgi:hypothetical protein